MARKVLVAPLSWLWRACRRRNSLSSGSPQSNEERHDVILQLSGVRSRSDRRHTGSRLDDEVLLKGTTDPKNSCYLCAVGILSRWYDNG